MVYQIKTFSDRKEMRKFNKWAQELNVSKYYTPERFEGVKVKHLDPKRKSLLSIIKKKIKNLIK